jgi:acyl carrier protein
VIEPAAEVRPGRAPRTDTEARVCEIYQEILGRPDIDVTASFTDLGGNSILAARITARIRVRLGVPLDLSAILRHRSVRELAASIDALAAAPTGPAQTAPRREASRVGLPMSFFQEWRFRSDAGRTAPLYTISLGYDLRGPLSAGALQEALTALACRHEPLRTNYDLVDDRPVQVIHPPAPVDLPVLDTRGRSEPQSRAEALRLLETRAAEPVDRRQGAIFAPALARYADEGHLLLLRLDRIAADGTSCQLIEEELGTLYAQALDGGVELADPPQIQQADWAAWQRRVLDGAYLDRLVAFWRRSLDSSRPLLELSLPALPAGSVAPRPRTTHRHLGLPLSARLRERAREADVTLFMYVLAALSAFIGRLAQRSEATVLCPYANRTRPELERVVGCFSHGVVYRTDLSGQPRFRDLVWRVRDGCLAAWEHLELPISEVARHVRPGSYLNVYDEFHVFFDLVRDVEILRLPGLSVQPTVVGTGAAHPSLAVLVDEGSEDLGLIVRVPADRFEPPALEWLADAFAGLLASAAQDPAQLVSALPPSAAQAQQHLAGG